MERKWIVSAFVDLRGFGTWIYRAQIAREVKEPFLTDYLEIVQDYVRQHPECHIKYLGDGFLAIREFTEAEKKDKEAVCRFVKSLRTVVRKILCLIDDCSQPPTGVRIRISEGYAYKVLIVDPNDPERKAMIPEFIEYCLNTAERLMGVNPEIICVVTEGVAKALAPCRSFFGMRKLGTPSTFPKGVNREDLETLETLRF